MTVRDFRLHLDADVAISATGATQGAPRTRPIIPGSVLLGAVARHYNAFDAETAWRVFHAGAVRFGNAYPMTAEGEPTIPVPLAWHAAKGGDGTFYNLAIREVPGGVQPEQLRGRFVTRCGGALRPHIDHRQMTAIDREKFGAARNGALFGISRLRRGQAYWCRIQFAQDLGVEVIRKVTDALTTEPLRLGRARHAEHGAVSLAPLDEGARAAVDELLATGEWNVANLVPVYLVSDLAPTMGEGAALPRAIGPEMFGLPEHWRFRPDRSFLRSDRWSPFNGKRRLHDHERQVWQQGSVLTFESNEGDDVAAALARARERTAGGVGCFRADGLGQVLIAPRFLAWDEQSIRPADTLRTGSNEAAQAPDDALMQWALARATARRMPMVAGQLADEQLPKLKDLYRHAWQEARRNGEAPYSRAPAAAQWAELGTYVARRCADAGETVSLDPLRAEIGINGGETSFCDTGGRYRVWVSFEKPGTGETFLGVLDAMTDSATLDHHLQRNGLATTDANRVRLARDAVRALAHRLPRTLAQMDVGADGMEAQ